MSKRNYDEASVVKSISRISGISVLSDKTIEVLRDASSVGIGTWGKIDYLVKCHDYIYHIVGNFTGKKNTTRNNDSDDSGRITKAMKREQKFSIANQVRNSMKKEKK